MSREHPATEHPDTGLEAAQRQAARRRRRGHPDYHPVVFRDAASGHQFLTRSTATSDRRVDWSDGNSYPLIISDITSDSHPLWTGQWRVRDVAGRVERFRRRYGDRVR